MVVGSGMIAKRFSTYAEDDRFIIFASGVSNSSQQEQNAFERERNLIQKTSVEHPQKLMVYFSTCSIYDASLAQSSYVQHKLKMEKDIQQHKGGYLIFRVSNPIGKTENKHTLLSFFIDAIQQQKLFTVYDGAERNLMDLDDMFATCDFVLQKGVQKNQILNIANPHNYRVTDIVHQLESYFSQKANIRIESKVSVPEIDTSEVQPIYHKLNIHFPDNYLLHLLQKYYPLS